MHPRSLLSLFSATACFVGLSGIAAAQPAPSDPAAQPAPSAPTAHPVQPGDAPPPAGPPGAPGWSAVPAAVTPGQPETAAPGAAGDSAPSEPAQRPRDGVTADGYPITRRGHFSIEVATMQLPSYSALSGATISQFTMSTALEATAHPLPGLAANVRYATAALLVSGNLMLGADYTLKLDPTSWVTVGGAFGLPFVRQGAGAMVPSYGLVYSALSQGLWNLHEYTADAIPLRIDLGYDGVFGPIGVRIDVQPVVYFPFDTTSMSDVSTNTDPQLVVQHALEVQYGHRYGVGVRYQGVANTFYPDAYQGVVEPFVLVRTDLGFARFGVMKTLDEDNAPGDTTYDGAWGARFSAGFHLD
ncbi:MAG: hypothetical protein U0441_08010 [Polyangiaceae bacterium]